MDAAFEQDGGDGAGGASGAQDQGGAGAWVYVVGAQVLDEAPAVGVAAGDLSVVEDKGVDGAGAAGGFVHDVADREGADLVGDGHVQAGETGQSEALDGGREVSGVDRQRHIGAVDLVALQPEAVQPGGAGVADGPAGDAREARFAGKDGHSSRFVGLRGSPCRRVGLLRRTGSDLGLEPRMNADERG